MLVILNNEQKTHYVSFLHGEKVQDIRPDRGVLDEENEGRSRPRSRWKRSLGSFI